MKLTKIKVSLSLIITLLAFGSFLTTNAKSKYDYNKVPDYVKLKKDMYTGQHYKINGKKGKRIINKKGTILKVGYTYINGGEKYWHSQLLPVQKHYSKKR